MIVAIIVNISDIIKRVTFLPNRNIMKGFTCFFAYQKNVLNTLTKMPSSHSGKTQKNRTIKMKPIQPHAWVNLGDGFLPVMISYIANTIAPPSRG